MLVSFAGSGLLGKARSQPERVAQVLDKVRTDGVSATINSVRTRLDEPIALGYAQAGTVVELGEGVTRFEIGDTVASLGPHAEEVVIAETLCARVPAGIGTDEAAFASLGAIALEGIRLCRPELGESFVVTGLGLIGLLSVQLLRAHGCRVLGIDPKPERCNQAHAFGAEIVTTEACPLDAAMQISRGRGVDGVLLTMSTSSSEPVHAAAQMCRMRGRIVLVGVSGLELQRADFYEKELAFHVSRSAGPGRYDSNYEQRAADYPPGLVRWTAGRNLEAALDMMADERLDVMSLVSHRFNFDEADTAYASLLDDPDVLAILLRYPDGLSEKARIPELSASSGESRLTSSRATKRLRVGLVGAGQFARTVVLPTLRELGLPLQVAAASSASAASLCRQFGFSRITGEPSEVFDDEDVDVVFVLTRHDSHSEYVRRAIRAGKHVFVEKPLAISSNGLDTVIETREDLISNGGTAPIIGIGYNRRFAPITEKMLELLARQAGPKAVSILVNAGSVPQDHWTRDPTSGGGRIIGEGCHFVDLARCLVSSPITDVHAVGMGGEAPSDSTMITLSHADGSISSIAYLTNGSKRYVKEQVSVFAGGRVLVNSNFRRLDTVGWPTRVAIRRVRQDKGHKRGLSAFLAAAAGDEDYPIPFAEIVESTAATLLAINHR